MTSLVRRMLRRVERALPSVRGTTVLAYHLVEGGTRGVVDVPRETFRAQIDELARVARVVPLERALDDDDGDARPRVALTFDDAYQNFFDEAWPVLRERALPTTLFVPTGFIDGTIGAPIRGTTLAPSSWDTLARAVSEGLTLGSHTVTHRVMRALSDDEVREECVRSRARIEERTGRAPRAFCYPQAKWTARVERVVRAHYPVVVVGGGTKAHPRFTRAHRIPRVSVRRDMPTSLIAVLRAPICLEEAIGDATRRLR